MFNVNRYTILLLLIFTLSPFSITHAQTVTSSVSSNQVLIAQLLAQVTSLQQKIASLGGQRNAGGDSSPTGGGVTSGVSSPSCGITRTLALGSRGADVTCLQQFLITQNLLTSDSATGYFGKLTQAAVALFQRSHNLEAVGFVGRLTRVLINTAIQASLSVSSSTVSTSILTTTGSGGTGLGTGSGSGGGSLSCTPEVTQTKSVACSTGQTGTITQTRASTCPGPVWSDWQTTTNSCVQLSAYSCTFNGQTIASGQSVSAYQSQTVASGKTCISQTRTCTNGVLSGSYLYTSCTVALVPPYPELTHKPLIGIYYFGIWSPAMYADSTMPPNNAVPVGTIAQPTWWAGVGDFFQRTGSAYNIWKQRTPILADFSDRKPSIGYYDDSDVHTLEQHIDQASTASIDFFNFYWYWSSVKHAPIYTDGMKSFRQTSNKSKMRFTLSIYTSAGNPDLSIPSGDIDYTVASLFDTFSDPAYLRMGGRPVVSIGDAHGIGDGSSTTIQSFMTRIRQYAQNNALPVPIILTAPGVVDAWQNVASDGFQCLTPGTQGVTGGDDYDGYLARIPSFYSMLSSYNKAIAPCAASNIDERPRQEFAPTADPAVFRYYANFTPYKFYAGLQKVQVWQQGQTSPISNILSIYAWNEWQEGGYLEPNVRDGDLLLNLVQRAFRTVTLNRYAGSTYAIGHRVTTKTLATPWTLEQTWKIFNEQDPKGSRTPLYECRDASDRYFVSVSAQCEGSSSVDLLGYITVGQWDMQGTVPLYRCSIPGTPYNGDHFVSGLTDCGASASPALGIKTDQLLGYVFPY